MSQYTLLLIAGSGMSLGDAMLVQLNKLIGPLHHDNPRWLSPYEALEVALEIDGPKALDKFAEILRSAWMSEPIDIALVPSAQRRKDLLIADMESTIIEQECLDELGDFVGLRKQISDITTRAMQGELDFEAAIKARVELLKGLPQTTLGQVLNERITIMPGARTLVQTMAANGKYCALVSGGFTQFSGPIAAQLGFHYQQANILELENGTLSGTVREPVLGRRAKRAALERLCDEQGIAIERTLAVGDGANDLEMIISAGLGVAYHAKPMVTAKADAQIKHGDLTALLYLQGYKKEEFVG